MAYKKMRLKVSLRVALILLLCLFLAYSVFHTSFIIVPVVIGISILLLTVELVYSLEKMQRDISSFLMSVKHGDYSKTYTKKEDPISIALNEIVREFQHLRSEKESHYRYLQTVVEHVAIALISYNKKDGEVHLANHAFQRLMRIPYLKNIEGLSRVERNLFVMVKELKTGEKGMLKVVVDKELLQLSVMATEFKLQQQEFKLISFQNIKAELEEQELESWQKLIRVLTHEITNSVMPISSLSKMVNRMIMDESGQMHDLMKLDEEDREDIRTSLQTIHHRSTGLVTFVKNYRSVTKVPIPNFREIPVKMLFERVAGLYSQELKEKGITLETEMQDPNMTVTADLELVEQILINLLLNARDILENFLGEKKIIMQARMAKERVVIQVSDTGPGIEEEVLQQVFVPFFTTKEKGSGIGLSLSRQIMRQHKGRIAVQTKIGEGTTFTLEF